jgi:hypothetical protein
VDELSREELFWLPVIKAARAEASEQVARLEAAQSKNLAATKKGPRMACAVPRLPAEGGDA